jgi:hypothetical protein
MGPIPIRRAVPARRIAAQADSPRLPNCSGGEWLCVPTWLARKGQSIGTGTEDWLWAG